MWRLAAAGWRVRYEPQAAVGHEHPATTRGWLRRRAFYGTGAALLAGAVVTLVVAAPMPRVPGVLGKGAALGQAALTRAGFTVNIVKKNVSTGANNVVLSQTPAATQQAAPGSVVQLEEGDETTWEVRSTLRKVYVSPAE